MLHSVVELNNAMVRLEQAEEYVDRWAVLYTDWQRCAIVTRVVNMLRNNATAEQIRVVLLDVNGQYDDYMENQ
jgi:alpha-galactosidase